MNTGTFLSNLAVWWAQAALLTAIATGIAMCLRLPVGRGKLIYWQLTLAACLLLPLLGPWQQQVITDSLPVAGTSIPLKLSHVEPSAQIPWEEIAFAVLGMGILARLVLLLVGFEKLVRYRALSRPFNTVLSWVPEAEIRLSFRVASPVTFGWRSPVILLPATFPQLDSATREAILCHEAQHVLRRDWLFAFGEEIIRSALWFHPAMWWIINEIQLAREQVVDAAVIEILNTREQYVDALLTVAGGTGSMMDLAPAPLFLRKRHLKQRLMSILKESSMSKTRRISAFAASFTLLAGTCWLITNAIPLVAEPQYVSDAAGVTVNLNGSVLVHRLGVSYPPDLATRGVQGTVQAQVKLDGTGAVADVSILSGPDQLRASVLRSVLDWHFSRSEANSTRQISVSFEAPRPASGPVASVAITNVPMLGPATVTTTRTANGTSVRMSAGNTPARIVAIETSGLSEEASRNLLSSLPVHVGEMLTPEVMPKLFYAVRDYDEHLSLTVLPVSGPEVRINIHPQGPGPLAPPPPPPPPPPSGSASSFPAVRVGGAVQNANLITKVAPVYPLLAKQARVQGTVRFETTIGKDGTVQNLQLVSGPPLLVQAAMEAVQQWVYRPTLLNGEPVQVLTTVDINFTLAE